MRLTHALSIACLACIPANAQLPVSFAVTVDKGGGETVELNLTQHSVRSSDYLVRSWDTVSGYVEEHSQTNQVLEVRTYRGHVTENPNELVVAVVLPGDVMNAEGHIGKGRAWSVSGIDVSSALGNGPAGTPPAFTPPTPTAAPTNGYDYGLMPVQQYLPPTQIYKVHPVFDITSKQYDSAGGTVDGAVALTEHSVNVHDFFNVRDVMVNHELSEVIVRKEQFYASTAASNLRAEWLTQGQNSRGYIASYFPYNWSYAGGFASGSNFYNAGGEAVCVNAFYHENAHNFGADHYLYGRDTMGGNRPLHEVMNAQQVMRKVDQEVTEGDFLPVASYSTQVHPHTTIDLATTPMDTPVNLDVMANDWDANGDTLSIKSFTTTTQVGGTVTETGGILTYTPPSGYVGKDVIVCEIQDSTGLYTVEPVHIEVLSEGLTAHYAFEETSGSNVADSSGNNIPGNLIGSTFDADSAQGVVGNAISVMASEGMLCGTADLIDESLYGLTENAWPLEEPHTSHFFDPMDESFSVALWFNASEVSERTTLMHKSNKAAIGWEVYLEDGGNIAIRVRPWDSIVGNSVLNSGVTATPHTWYHVAMVLNRADNNARLYVNGVEQGTPLPLNGTDWFFEGRTGCMLGSHYWNGGPSVPILFDEVMTYSDALTPAEVQALHTIGDVPAGIVSPSNESLNQPTNTQLAWLEGHTSYLHQVYFGTDEAAVASATPASPEYQGQQTATTFDPGVLDFSKNYYWRIDEVDGGTIIPGTVWRFTTAATALTEHLVLHLTMDNVDAQTSEDGTHTYDDIAFPAQDFQSFNAIPGAAGIIGEAVDLNGTADTIRSYDTNPVVRPPSGGVSISFWINTTSTQSSNELVYSAGGAYFMLYDDGDLRLIFDGSSSGTGYFDTNINDGQWHHVVAHNDGSGLTTLYIDGAPFGTQSESLNDIGSLNRTMGIGSGYNGLGDNLEASFDDFAVWQRAITPAEVSTIHSLGLAGSTFNDVPILVDTSFEVAEGFTGTSAGSHSALGTEVDTLGVTWTEVSDARIWNRTDIPPDGVQSLALGINTSAASCDVSIPGTTQGVGIVSFDYASFSSSADNTFRLLYNDNAGSGWVEAWSTQIVGNNPDWTDKPWHSAEISINTPGDVDLRFETSGSRGVNIDNIKVTGVETDPNLPPTAGDTSGTVAENAGSGVTAATVVATDPNAGDSLDYSITEGNGAGLFEIDDNGDITTTADLDYESSSQHILTVTVSDLGGLFATATVTVDVTDINEDPAFTSDPIIEPNVLVFSTFSSTLAGTAIGLDAGETAIFSKLDGPDWLNVDSDGNLWGTPKGTDGGLNSFTVQVDDGTGNSGQATLQLTVDESGRVFEDGFESYDADNPSDFSIGGSPTGNWTTSSTDSDATRIFSSGNFGGTRLWISDVDGTSLTSAGIAAGSNADYTLSAVLVTETGHGNRTLNGTYDVLVGQTAETAVSLIGGPQAIVTHGDNWVTDNSKADHVFTENFQTGSLTPGDLLFVRFTRVDILSTGGWFGVDDVEVDLNGVIQNTPPTWNTSPVDETAATEGVSYNSTLADNASDLDLDTLMFSKTSGPDWLSIASDGSLSGSPEQEDVGSNSWTVDVSDGTAAPIEVTLNITVQADHDADGDPDVTDPDDDNDDIPDVWELANGLDPMLDDAAVDADMDGFTNGDEYLADTDPQDSGSRLALTLEAAPGSGIPTIRFDTSPNRVYTVEWHADLTNGPWQDLDPPMNGTGSEMTVPDSSGFPIRFYRLRVALP